MKIFLSLLLIFVLIMVAVFSAFAIRKTISEYAAQQAEALVLNIINSAVGEYLTENQISYDDVAAIVLIGISMLLTFIAGLIPSGFAAKKDPVVALRTE